MDRQCPVQAGWCAWRRGVVRLSYFYWLFTVSDRFVFLNAPRVLRTLERGASASVRLHFVTKSGHEQTEMHDLYIGTFYLHPTSPLRWMINHDVLASPGSSMWWQPLWRLRADIVLRISSARPAASPHR